MRLRQNSSWPGKRIAVVYHSAAGGTRVAAELIAELLAAEHDVRTASIHQPSAVRDASQADVLVLCYPTYFLRPSSSMKDFVLGLPPAARTRYAYLLTTYELYTENSLRECARMVRAAGFVVAGSAAVRAPGSDLVCVLPQWLCRGLYRFEWRFPAKLRMIAGEIGRVARQRRRMSPPRLAWYTPLAQPLQRAFFDRFLEQRSRIRIVEERCTDCGACVSLCYRGAWSREAGSLHHQEERCELCTRCIHHCPRNAIILSSMCRNNRRLDARHYAALKSRARRTLGLPAEAELAAANPRGGA